MVVPAEREQHGLSNDQAGMLMPGINTLATAPAMQG